MKEKMVLKLTNKLEVEPGELFVGSIWILHVKLSIYLSLNDPF